MLPRGTLQELFVKIPTPVSRPAYALWRHLVKDGKEPLFLRAFEVATRDSATGDYLEFGVYRGTSFILAFNTAKKLGLSGMRFWAFDGFVGLPSSDERFKKGKYKCSRPAFELTIRHAGVDLSRVHIVEGLYHNTLAKPLSDGLREAAVIHVDCDLYESTVPVLRFIEPLLRHRTVLIFDDWHDRSMNRVSGEAKAFEEWAEAPGWEILYDAPPNRAFIRTHAEP